MLFDCNEVATKDLYKLLISLVVPRPIAWISSVNGAGNSNLAPFSFFNAFSVEPPILGIGIGSKRGLDDKGNPTIIMKDTYANIMETKQFVVHVVQSPLAELMNQSSANYKSSDSEIEKLELETLESTYINVPRIKECQVAMECELFNSVPLGNSNLVLGKVICIHVDDKIIESGEICIEELNAIGRLGGVSYCQVDSVFDIKRPKI